MNEPVSPANIDTSSWASPDEYNRLIRSLKLQDIRMVRGQFSAAKEYEGEVGLRSHITFSGRFQATDSGFVAFHAITFEGRCEENEERIVGIEAEYAVKYESDLEIREDLFLPFLYMNLPVQTWPFFREFVQSSVSRLHWPQVTLPTLHSTGGRIEFPAVPTE
jgi:hypothetical protein